MGKLSTVCNGVLKTGFPELSYVKINLKRLRNGARDYFSAIEFVRQNEYNLEVDDLIRRKQVPVLEGCLAHELAHISLDFRRNQFVRQIDRFLYGLSGRYRVFDERRADLLVVKKGYGNQLLKFLEFADNNYEEYCEKDGLTVNELRKILN